MAKQIKKHRLALLCALFLPCLLVLGAFAFISGHHEVKASPHGYENDCTIATGTPVFGSTTMVMSVAATSSPISNFSVTSGTVTGGTATLSGGTGSIPCYNMQLSVLTSSSSVSVLMGSSSSNCYFALPTNTTSGTTGAQYYTFLAPTNTNQLWFKLTNTNPSTVGGGTISAIYTQ